MAKEIDHPIERTITETELNQLQSFVTSASSGVAGAINVGNPNTKVYFVGFDGKSNNKGGER